MEPQKDKNAISIDQDNEIEIIEEKNTASPGRQIEQITN